FHRRCASDRHGGPALTDSFGAGMDHQSDHTYLFPACHQVREPVSVDVLKPRPVRPARGIVDYMPRPLRHGGGGAVHRNQDRQDSQQLQYGPVSSRNSGKMPFADSQFFDFFEFVLSAMRSKLNAFVPDFTSALTSV